MSRHIRQGFCRMTKYGVPTGLPSPGLAMISAWKGQALAQSPHFVHAARNRLSSTAPGGRRTAADDFFPSR
jgi:hypothetical protein